MPRKKCCGRAEAQCFCEFADSDSVAVQGGGDQPFSLEVQPTLQTLDTESLAWTLNGSELSATAFSTVDVQIFEADGTYTAPPGASVARILLIGGGQSGYGGGDETSGNGGLGGSLLIAHLVGGSIPASAPVTVGTGGSPTPSGAASGGTTNFNTQFFARGGGSVGGDAIQCPGANFDSASHASRILDPFITWEPVLPRVTQGWPYYTPGGGGRGQGIPFSESQVRSATAGMWSLATKGARPFPSSDNDSLGLSGNPGSPGEPGTDNLVTFAGSGGGGGETGQNGGDGGKYGAGGGGGGAPGVGNPDTLGGNGADGVCVVITW